MPRFVVGLIIGLVSFLSSVHLAEAGLKICNESGSSRSIAIAYKDGDNWRSEGWWNISDQACKTVEGGELKQRYYYYRAEHKGREIRSGDYRFCTTSKAFEIVGEKDCEARGFVSSSFRVIDTGTSAKDFTFTLKFNTSDKKEEAKAPKQSADVPMTSVPRFSGEPFAVGSLGEPFAVVGVFQGCDNIDGWDHCTYHAEGARHAAAWGEGTPDEILQALENVAPGTRMLVRGDMKSFGDITAEVAIRQLEPVRQEALDTRIEAIQGYWESDKDSSWYFQIHGSERRDFYDGNLSANEYIQWASDCDAGSQGGTDTYMIITNPEDREYSQCFHVVSVGRNHLILNFVGGNGQDMDFARQQ